MELLVEEEQHEFNDDLRSEGISQDAIPEDRQRMTKIQKMVDKLRAGYHTKSIVADLVEDRKIPRFCEESSRTIQELGKGEISKPFNVKRA